MPNATCEANQQQPAAHCVVLLLGMTGGATTGTATKKAVKLTMRQGTFAFDHALSSNLNHEIPQAHRIEKQQRVSAALFRPRRRRSAAAAHDANLGRNWLYRTLSRRYSSDRGTGTQLSYTTEMRRESLMNRKKSMKILRTLAGNVLGLHTDVCP